MTEVDLYNLSPTARLLGVGFFIAVVPLLWTYYKNRGANVHRKMRSLVVLTLFLTFDLVLFGSFTRLTDSGLGCPDWPGCYGHASPIGADAHIDAAVAVNFALAVCHPAAGNIGGGGFLVYRTSKGKAYTLDYREMAPTAGSRDMYLDSTGQVIPGKSFVGIHSVGVPGAVAGKLRPYKTWRPIEQATMSYGYGLSASLFQIAQAYTVFAHDGEMVPMSLVKTNQSQVNGARVFSSHNAAAIRNMLHMVTIQGGTAPKAQTMGYSVGGKTGTAHKVEGKGYASKKYRGFFVGIAPIDNPRIVVAVMVDEPTGGAYFGGDVAAPVFSQTVQQTLRMMGVQPDMAVKPQVVTKVEKESF